MGKLATHVYHNYGITTVGDSSSNEWCWKAKGESSIIKSIVRPIRDFIPPSSTLTKSIAAELSLVYHSVPHGYSYIRQSLRSIRDFIPPSSTLTKPIAAELSLVYHSVRHGYSYISQSCIVDLLKKIFNEFHIGQNISCGKTKARELSVNVLDVGEQPRESAENITNTIHDILKKNNLDIQKLTSIGADNTRNCFCHVLSDSVKTSHQYLPVDVESYLSQLYSHLSSSSKYVANLKDYFEFVEEDYLYTFSFLSSPSQSSS
ncbi:unnamed protein product [Rotaria sordida]|uniref:Uncharacterized protein n=1 Tax=Rotaria sordida TaxID=392033 RepID=A0A814AP88_9BILA|nr:unnamed protein product [Rotaria sordida]